MRVLSPELVLFTFLLFPLLGHAQTVENNTHIVNAESPDQPQKFHQHNGLFSVGLDILPGDQTTSPRWKTSYRRRLSPTLTGKIGAGFTYYNDPLSLLPLFIALRYRFMQTSVFPFISIKAGYNFSILTDAKTLVDHHKGGLLFNPAIGVQFTLTKDTAIYFIGGYNIDKASFRYERYDRTVTTNITYKRFMAGVGLIF